jgi:dihydrofolate reductase
MSVKCSVFIATSVDGFIARPDGAIDWLEKPEFLSQDELGLHYDQFIATVDTLVMGRKCFEKALTFSSWPYEGVPVVVLSSHNPKIPNHLRGKVILERGEPENIISRIAPEGNQHLYIDGGNTIQRFLKSRLITDITVTQIPVLLGSGISLFGASETELALTHVQTSAASNGLVQSQYRQ